jgi:hypothetical protein
MLLKYRSEVKLKKKYKDRKNFCQEKVQKKSVVDFFDKKRKPKNKKSIKSQKWPVAKKNSDRKEQKKILHAPKKLIR